MRTIANRTLFTFFAITLLCSLTYAQSLDLPQLSQYSKITQRIGVTDITVTYHRPLINERKVWGGLVPYGQAWRTGADENTIIEFSDNVMIEGKLLAKGSYGLHTIPNENEWTIIFSKNNYSWGSFTYDQTEDALRVTVKPRSSEYRETMSIDFDNVQPASALLTIRWEKLAVPVKIEVNINEAAANYIRNQLKSWTFRSNWSAFNDGANYFLNNKLNLDDALKLADQSVRIEERFDNQMTRSRILDAQNNPNGAAAAKKRAMEIATAVQLNNYGRSLQRAGKQEEAFTVFRYNIKERPDDWTSHSQLARIAVAAKDFDTALKEMNLALNVAPEQSKVGLQTTIKRLENKEDINK